MSGVTPETAIRLHRDLSKAREVMVLATPLHLLYLVRPSKRLKSQLQNLCTNSIKPVRGT